MFSWWYLAFTGCLLMGVADCTDTYPLSADEDPMEDSVVTVNLSVDTMPKAHSPQKQVADAFSCHECTNCDANTDANVRTCPAGVTMCYRMEDAKRVVRRGCATARGQCVLPDSDQSSRFDTITCCTTPKCNQAVQLHPLFLLLATLGVLTTMIMRI